MQVSTAGAEPARVVIRPPESAGPLLEEALIRIRGELRAVGLHVEVLSDPGWSPDDLSPLEAGDYGVIVLSQQGTRIDIRAYAPGLETPVSQSAHTSYPGMDAEVVAVRAVEALRAAMIQFARNREAEGEPLPPAVTDFTRLGSPPAPAPPAAEPRPPAPEPPPVAPAPPRADPDPAHWSLWLGGFGLLDFPAATELGGVQGALWWHPSWLSVGVLGQRTLTGGQVDEPEGAAAFERSAVQLLVGAERPLSERAFALFAAGVGAVHHRARADASPGFNSATSTHLSPVLSAQLGAGYRFAPPLGAFVLAGVEVLADAPRVRFDGRDVATLGRPTLTLALGLTFDL